jgi:hypothetical protein
LSVTDIERDGKAKPTKLAYVNDPFCDESAFIVNGCTQSDLTFLFLLKIHQGSNKVEVAPSGRHMRFDFFNDDILDKARSQW